MDCHVQAGPGSHATTISPRKCVLFQCPCRARPLFRMRVARSNEASCGWIFSISARYLRASASILMSVYIGPASDSAKILSRLAIQRCARSYGSSETARQPDIPTMARCARSWRRKRRLSSVLSSTELSSRRTRTECRSSKILVKMISIRGLSGNRWVGKSTRFISPVIPNWVLDWHQAMSA